MLDFYISHPVGLNATRSKISDIKMVQTALNSVLIKDEKLAVDLCYNGAIDGIVGPKTIAAIEFFQRTHVDDLWAYGKMDPDGKSMNRLRELTPEALILDRDALRCNPDHVPEMVRQQHRDHAQMTLDLPIMDAENEALSRIQSALYEITETLIIPATVEPAPDGSCRIDFDEVKMSGEYVTREGTDRMDLIELVQNLVGSNSDWFKLDDHSLSFSTRPNLTRGGPPNAIALH